MAPINLVAIPATESGGLGSLSARTFGEASVNLQSLFAEGECEAFGSVYLKSRSSDTFSSALKDFIAPAAVNISNCGSITIIKDAQPDNAQDFDFSGDLGAFTLDDDANATLDDREEFLGLVAGDYAITETGETGWTLDDIDCGDEADVDVVGSAVTIHLAAKENVTCTFTNIQNTFKILVLTCTNDGTTLVPSSIRLDNTGATTNTPTSIGSLSVADVCALAEYSNVVSGAHEIDVGVNTPTP